MESAKGLFFLVAIAAWVAVVNVKGGPVDELQSAFDSLEAPMKEAFNALGGPNVNGSFFESLLDVVKCVQDKLVPFDVCNFNTSLDPFYYLQECANGTLALEIIEKLVQNVPGVTVPFGFPPQVSKDRCIVEPSIPTALTDLSALLPTGI